VGADTTTLHSGSSNAELINTLQEDRDGMTACSLLYHSSYLSNTINNNNNKMHTPQCAKQPNFQRGMSNTPTQCTFTQMLGPHVICLFGLRPWRIQDSTLGEGHIPSLLYLLSLATPLLFSFLFSPFSSPFFLFLRLLYPFPFLSPLRSRTPLIAVRSLRERLSASSGHQTYFAAF